MDRSLRSPLAGSRSDSAVPSGRRPMSRRPVAWVLLPLLLALPAALACSTSADEISAEDRAAIEELIEGFLPRMAEAYRQGDAEVVRGYAVEKEIATLQKRINDLANQEGRIVASELKTFEIEDVSTWNYSNAFVTTMEIWDVQVLATGSETVLSEVLDQRNRVRYQLKRTDEGWRIIYRERQTTFEE